MIKLLLNIILITITFCACYLEDLYLDFWLPKPGSSVLISIRSQQPFSYDQAQMLEKNRKEALSQYRPVFNYLTENVQASKNKINQLIRDFTNTQAQQPDRIETLRNSLKASTGVQISRSQLNRILSRSDLLNLLQGIKTAQESVSQGMILPEDVQLSNPSTIELRNHGAQEKPIIPINEVKTLEEARQSMAQKVRQLFWRVDKRVLDPLILISTTTIQPNLQYDLTENNRRVETIISQYPAKVLNFQPGEILVPFRRVLNENDVLLLNAYQKQRDNKKYRDMAWVLFAIMFMVIFYNLFLSRILAAGYRQDPPYRLLISLLIITVGLLKVGQVFTPLPVYFLPFSLLPMLVISLNHGKTTAIGTTLVGVILISLFAGRTFEIMLFFTFGGLWAVLISSRIEKRLHILIPSILVGFINAVSVTVLTIDWYSLAVKAENMHTVGIVSLGQLFSSTLTANIVWAFIGGLIAGPIVLLLLPLLEVSSHTASTFKLNRYADPQRPLMKRLQSEAPGTYQHSVTVAVLAQSAGEAVGANILLLRIGSYYHDIGKMMTPRNFIENQFNGENPHDAMDPEESASVIIDHVKYGVKTGLESRLPRAVVDLISQHHGTHLIEYFYSVATKTYPAGIVDQDDFRYNGPKPQSVEAAILMIADAVEAASRSIQEPTRKKFENMIRMIVVKRIADGQFSECSLTTNDIEKIIRALVDTLEASFHSRIRYPDQEKPKTKPKTRWIFGIDEKERDSRSFRL